MDFPSHYFIKILLIRGCILPQQSPTQSHPPDRPGPSPPSSICSGFMLSIWKPPVHTTTRPVSCTVSPPASGTGPRPYGLSGLIRKRLRLWFRFLSGDGLGTDWTVHPIWGLSPPWIQARISSPKKQRLPPYRTGQFLSSSYNPVHLRYSFPSIPNGSSSLEAI